MSDIVRYIKKILVDKNIDQKTFASEIGYSTEYVSRIMNGKNPSNVKFETIVKSKYDININPEDSFKSETIKKFSETVEPLSLDITVRNVPLVNKYAYASFSESWDDPEFLESMTTVPTFQLDDGNYLWFEIKGDSMTRSEDPSLNEGDLILVRELYRHHWNGLQLRRAKIWVINHRTNGIMVKEIIKQTKNIITCMSWNTLVPIFELDLNEVNQLFYFKEVRKTNFY